jgi:DNA-binding response OmpR family regulator
MPNILICDDEKDIVSALEIYLSSDGYQIYKAYNGEEALEMMKRYSIDLVLLDVMMPKMDGIQTITEIRKTSNVPVIFLTAKSEDTDMILGLNIGADDYITKPFNPVEVLARVKSNLRRYLTLGSQSKKDVYSMGGIELNPKAKEVTLDGDALSLTPTEFKILELLMERPGEVISPKEIYTSVWQDDSFGTENIVAVHVRHLREKIEIDPANPRHLKVVWGQGYKMEA